MFSRFLHSLMKTEANVWENSRADQRKPETQSNMIAVEFFQEGHRFGIVRQMSFIDYQEV